MVFAFVSCGGNDDNNGKTETDLKILNFLGKVKSVKESSYKAIEKFGKIEKGKLTHSFQSNYFKKFNEQGNITYEELYDEDGNIDSKKTYKYDVNNNIIEYVSLDSDGTSNLVLKYSYDNIGNMIESNRRGKGAFKNDFKKIYSYNNEGKVIEESGIGNDGITYMNKLKYEGENLIEINHYKSDGSLQYRGIINYDNNSNVIEKIKYNANGDIDSKEIFDYDNNSNLVNSQNYDSDGKLERESNYKYDDNNNVIEMINDNGIGSPSVYKYDLEYDKNGNCITKIEFYNIKANQILEREIIYY